MPGMFDAVIKCKSSIEAQKAAEFINKWFLIRASWDQNELTMWHGVKHRITYPDFDEAGEMCDCAHETLEELDVLKSGKILMRCTGCPHLFVKDCPESEPREPNLEDFQSSPTTARNENV